MNDPYIQKNGTLKNKFNIVDNNELEKKERTITALRLYSLQKNGKIKRTYDLEHLKNIHKELFSDIYSWAGKIRTVDIAKGNTLFCKPVNIESFAENIFSNLKRNQFFKDSSKDILAYNLSKIFLDVNALHPFREGNGRVQREFIRQLAEDRGYILDFGNINNEKMIDLSIKDDPKELSKVFLENMVKIKEQEINPWEQAKISEKSITEDNPWIDKLKSDKENDLER